jgi:enoyl-CoA hydratase/carnithine racemase
VRIDAEQARAMGFVQEVVRESLALPRAIQLAERIAGYPQASLRSDRTAARAALGTPLSEGLLFERHLGAKTLSASELVDALERYAKGDRPAPPEPA